MNAALGKIVMHRGIESNGNKTHPAIITRVWGDSPSYANGEQYISVNLTIFPDAAAPVQRTSVPLFLTQRSGELAELHAYAYHAEPK